MPPYRVAEEQDISPAAGVGNTHQVHTLFVTKNLNRVHMQRTEGFVARRQNRYREKQTRGYQQCDGIDLLVVRPYGIHHTIDSEEAQCSTQRSGNHHDDQEFEPDNSDNVGSRRSKYFSYTNLLHLPEDVKRDHGEQSSGGH